MAATEAMSRASIQEILASAAGTLITPERIAASIPPPVSICMKKFGRSGLERARVLEVEFRGGHIEGEGGTRVGG